MWMEGGTKLDGRGAKALIYANTDWAWGLWASLLENGWGSLYSSTKPNRV